MCRLEFEQPIAIELPEDEQIDRFYRYAYLAECNQAFADIYGKSPQEMIGWRFADLALHEPELRDETPDQIRASIRSRYKYTSVERRRSWLGPEPRYLLRSNWGIVEDGLLRRVWFTARDITDLKRTENALRASEQRLRDVLNCAGTMAFFLDGGGAVNECNQHVHHFTGWSEEELRGANWLELLFSEDNRRILSDAIHSVMFGSRQVVRVQNTMRIRDGTERIIAWDCTRLPSPEGKSPGSACLGRDRTEQVALEIQARQTQKLETIGRLASTVAHDFSNLLSVILGYSEALLNSADKTGPAAQMLNQIKAAAEESAALTHQILEFSRGRPAKIVSLNLTSLISEYSGLIRALLGQGVELRLLLDPDLGRVLADPNQIRQAIMNLAVNARDAMPARGIITISTQNATLYSGRPVDLAAIPPDAYVSASVEDTGTGLASSVKEHLFEPFFTTKEDGTGLGLATVYNIVRQSGGYIAVNTEIGKGSTFTLYLPRTA